MSDNSYIKRNEYFTNYIDTNGMGDEPMAEFGRWFNEAMDNNENEPNAVSVATVGADNNPHVRIALMKRFTEQGIYFFTNYNSQKGQDIASNDQVALVFWWRKQFHQIRFEGHAERLTPEENQHYFNTRSRESQVNAIVSPQSEVITSHADLNQRIEAFDVLHAGQALQCPEHWGGYLVVPTLVEFWQAKPHRQHERIQYKLEQDEWVKRSLAP
jgi:pyridoxamine 5'-phosphate oxidase